MSRSARLETPLFWLMFLLGGVVLVPAMLLPPWLDYQRQLGRRHAALVDQARAKQQLDAARKQIDHIRTDPAYVLRLADEEFGFRTPAQEPPPVHVAEVAPEAEFLPELKPIVADGIARYPLVLLLADGPNRRYFLLLGVGLILLALVLLQSGRKRQPVRARAHSRDSDPI